MNYLSELKEECGVLGIYGIKTAELKSLLYTGMMTLQHRGEDSAGITIRTNDELKNYKSLGNTNDLFKSIKDLKLTGSACIAHLRYTTFGDNIVSNAQPIISKDKTISIAHNGNIYNALMLKEFLMKKNIEFNSNSDTEVLLHLIKYEKYLNLEENIIEAIKKLKGAYAVVMLMDNKLIGIRDPHGIRPLFLGKLKSFYILSSETCTFDAVGAEYIREINPGEIIIIDEKGIKSINYKPLKSSLCAFEYIYFSRADSSINNKSLYKVRENLGKQLGKKYPIHGEVVIGVPNSGIPAAVGYAEQLGIPYKPGFVRNNYIGRTFIKPTQLMRQKDLSIKLNVIKENIENKKVIVIDDSIVRGTTSKKIVNSLKNAGASEVHLLIASPKIDYTCNLGVNISTQNELLSNNKTIDDMKETLEVDTLGYLNIDDLYEIFETDNICTGCFNGKYPVL